MTWFSRKRERLPEATQLQELDELHYLATAVFARREDKDWSQDRLALVAGMTQAQIATIEAGHANPTIRTLVKLAQALECTVKDLFAPCEERPHEVMARFAENLSVFGSYLHATGDLWRQASEKEISVTVWHGRDPSLSAWEAGEKDARNRISEELLVG